MNLQEEQLLIAEVQTLKCKCEAFARDNSKLREKNNKLKLSHKRLHQERRFLTRMLAVCRVKLGSEWWDEEFYEKKKVQILKDEEVIKQELKEITGYDN